MLYQLIGNRQDKKEESCKFQQTTFPLPTMLLLWLWRTTFQSPSTLLRLDLTRVLEPPYMLLPLDLYKVLSFPSILLQYESILTFPDPTTLFVYLPNDDFTLNPQLLLTLLPLFQLPYEFAPLPIPIPDQLPGLLHGPGILSLAWQHVDMARIVTKTVIVFITGLFQFIFSSKLITLNSFNQFCSLIIMINVIWYLHVAIRLQYRIIQNLIKYNRFVQTKVFEFQCFLSSWLIQVRKVNSSLFYQLVEKVLYKTQVERLKKQIISQNKLTIIFRVFLQNIQSFQKHHFKNIVRVLTILKQHILIQTSVIKYFLTSLNKFNQLSL